MRTRLLFAALSALSLASCGGGSTPADLINEGHRALSSGDASEALAKYDGALAELQPSDPRYVEAKIGALRAQAYGDPKDAEKRPKADAAVVGFLALAKADPVPASEYRMFVTDLANAGAYQAAIDVLEAGNSKYPDDPKWKALQAKLVKAADAAGDSGAMDRMKGLGYVGND